MDECDEEGSIIWTSVRTTSLDDSKNIFMMMVCGICTKMVPCNCFFIFVMQTLLLSNTWL